MSAAIPNYEPMKIVAGDTLVWTKQLPDYLPADGWELSYQITSANGKCDLTGATFVGSGNSFTCTVPATVTAKWKAGKYTMLMFVKNNGVRVSQIIGLVQVHPNPESGNAVDMRTHNERMLEAIKSVLEGKSTSDVVGYTIAGREITKLKPDELEEWKRKYEWRVAREKGTAPEFYGAAFRRPI